MPLDTSSSGMRAANGKGASKWPLTSVLPITSLHEAWVLGNGDLAALVTFTPGELCFQLGKSDIWDARFDSVTKDWVLKQDDLIRYVKDLGMTWPGSSWPLSREQPTWPGRRPDGIPDYCDQPPAFEQIRYRPGPKPAGHVRLFVEAMAETRIEAALDVARACLSLRIFLKDSTLHVEAFIERERNVLWLKVRTEQYGGYAEVVVEKAPDSYDAEMPLPVLRCLDDRRVLISQTIPAGCDVESFTWCLCGNVPALCGPPGGEAGVRNYPGSWRFTQRTTLLPDQPLHVAVGVTTSREAGGSDAPARAAGLVADVSASTFAAARKRHEAAWAKLWSSATVELDDDVMEAAWHRDLYNLACSHAPHIQAPGLAANVPFGDSSMWHGDYHWNMNIGKMYSVPIVAGHPEWLDSYAALIEQQLPTFQHLARLIFDLPGAYVDHINFAYVPPHRTMIHNRWGRSLSLTGITFRPLWERWEYSRDTAWLRRIYPFLREAAVFYSAFMDKYFDSLRGIGPSMWLEGPGWLPGFDGNMNLSADLVYFRKILLWAAEAAAALWQDSDLRERWLVNAGRVPEVRYGTDDKGPWVEQPGRNHAAFIVAHEHVYGDEPEGLGAHLRAMTAGTVEKYANACRHMSHEMIGLVRLQPRTAYDVFRMLMTGPRQQSGQTDVGGHIPTHWRAHEDHYLGVRGVAELLLQSQGGVIRLFPGWPAERAAHFAGFPARGGFHVDATQDAKGRVTARILSGIGGICRLRIGRSQRVAVTCDGQAVGVTAAGTEISFETEAGKVYDVTCDAAGGRRADG